jgi:hypothetical protein
MNCVRGRMTPCAWPTDAYARSAELRMTGAAHELTSSYYGRLLLFADGRDTADIKRRLSHDRDNYALAWLGRTTRPRDALSNAPR